MTPSELRTLARVLGAILPSRIVDPAGSDPCAARALAEQREIACETADRPHPAPASPPRTPCRRAWGSDPSAVTLWGASAALAGGRAPARRAWPERLAS